MEEVNLYIETNLKGPRRQTGSCMYLLTMETSKGPQTRGRVVKLEDTTENQITLAALDEALGRIKRPVRVCLWLDCKYVAGAIANEWPQAWEKAGWMTSKGKTVTDAEKWQSVLEKIRAHEVSVKIGEHHEYKNWMLREITRAVEEGAAAGGLMPAT